MTELKHSIQSGLRDMGVSKDGRASGTPELVLFPDVHIFILLGAQKAAYAFSPERRHLGLYAPDMID